MPIELSAVYWPYVGVLALLAFISALLGNLIAFRNKFGASVVAAILFAIGFVFWTYYPHDNLPSPLSAWPTSATPGTSATPPASTTTQ